MKPEIDSEALSCAQGLAAALLTQKRSNDAADQAAKLAAVRLRVTDAAAEPVLRRFSLHRASRD